MGALSKLAAVNRMLRGAGESPVNTIVDDGVNDVSLAVSILDETSMLYQIDRQSFNTTNTTLTPDNDGYIYVTDGLLFIDTRGDHADISISVRGTPPKLYNMDDLTDVWTHDLQVKQTVLAEFEDIPTPDQFSITDMAARVYQAQTVGDPQQDAVLSQIELRSRMRARANEFRQMDWNMLRQSTIANYIANPKYRRYLDGRG